VRRTSVVFESYKSAKLIQNEDSVDLARLSSRGELRSGGSLDLGVEDVVDDEGCERGERVNTEQAH
jgi:hypothetical protein